MVFQWREMVIFNKKCLQAKIEHALRIQYCRWNMNFPKVLKSIFIGLSFLMILSCGAGGGKVILLNDGTLLNLNVKFNAGLVYANGIEPGDPAVCGVAAGNKCWYVDASAADGGNGSFDRPYNSFEAVIGYRHSNGNYVAGLIQGGDHLYITGEFKASLHVADGVKSMRLVVGRGVQGGTIANPTVIKSYPGRSRAVFDGEFRDWGVSEDTPGVIDISALSSEKLESIIIQNIEVKNAKGVGVSIKENVIHAELASLVVHDTAIITGASSSGGVYFRMTDSLHDYILRNSYIYSNHRNTNGVGFYQQANNNIGGVNVLNQSGALDGSKVTIYGNIIQDEIDAIRHKHSGGIITEAYSNLIYDSIFAFYIRGYKNNLLHHNLIIDADAALYAEAENQTGDMMIRYYNNTMIDVGALINTGNSSTSYKREINIHDNILSSDRDASVLVLGFNTTDVYNINDWSSHHNLYDYTGSAVFMRHEGVELSFEDAMLYVSDTTSSMDDPEFSDASNGDYSLRFGSPAINMGSQGQDLGAIADDG